MTFIDFIRNIPLQEDPSISRFLKWGRNDNSFPKSSDPKVLGQYLYMKLDPDLTMAFMKMIMFYSQVEPNNEIPSKYKSNDNLFLEALNHIIDLQNKDKNYHWADQLPVNQ